jgi:6-phosphofructokinase 1
LGAAAVEKLIEGKSNLMVGEINGRVIETPLSDTWQKHKEINPRMLELAEILSL